MLDRTVETLLKRDRLIVVACLIGITLIAWAYLVSLASNMNAMEPPPTGMSSMNMSGMEMPMAEIGQLRAWTAADLLLTFTMWSVMMVGMMSPSATPMILLYARVCRKREDLGQPFVPTGAFFAGYIAVWVVFSVGATSLQWGLEQAALLSPLLVSVSRVLSGVFLIAAGIYQWTAAKQVCLRYCRSPVEFLSLHWRKGMRGAFMMGLEHGKYCLGCCWALMLLLFVGGLMNLLWLAALSLLVLIEKISGFGRLVGQIGGAALIAAGILILLR